MKDAYDIKRKEHLEDLKIQEDERKKMFICRVRDKEAELKLAENNVYTFLLSSYILKHHIFILICNDNNNNNLYIIVNQLILINTININTNNNIQ